MGWGGPQYVQEQYQAGTLVVDMADARTRRLVWRGSVQNAVGNPARIADRLTKEAERIVEKFPEQKSEALLNTRTVVLTSIVTDYLISYNGS